MIQYAIDEARTAGIERMVFVSHDTKPAVERHVMDDLRLRRFLEARGKEVIADELKEAALHAETDEVVFTLQNEPKGLGHAVLCARDHILDGAVAVILPDDLILGTPCLSKMGDAYDGGHMVATMTVGDADIFEALATQTPGAGGEIQLTDAIAADDAARPISGFGFSGTRFDCGSKAGMLEATLHLAAQDPELIPVLETYCGQTLGTRNAAQARKRRFRVGGIYEHTLMRVKDQVEMGRVAAALHNPHGLDFDGRTLPLPIHAHHLFWRPVRSEHAAVHAKYTQGAQRE